MRGGIEVYFNRMFLFFFLIGTMLVTEGAPKGGEAPVSSSSVSFCRNSKEELTIGPG